MIYVNDKQKKLLGSRRTTYDLWDKNNIKYNEQMLTLDFTIDPHMKVTFENL